MPDNSLHSDEILVQRLREGDETAFTLIFNRYWKELFCDAQKILKDEGLADDCVQEVFFSLWKRREETEITYLKAYLKKSVRFQVLWLIRERKVCEPLFDDISTSITKSILDDPYLIKELDYLFKGVMNELPGDQLEIFKLIREEGLSYKEIAERTGLSVKSVERKMSQSLKHFKIKMGDLLHFFL